MISQRSVLPIYGIDRREEARQGDVLLPGGVRPGRRQAEDGVRTNTWARPPRSTRRWPGAIAMPVGHAASGVRGGRGRLVRSCNGWGSPGSWMRWSVLVVRTPGPRSGPYLALAALNRLVDPRSKRSFADWWAGTAAERFTRIPAPAVLDHRRAWDATHGVSAEDLAEIERRIGAGDGHRVRAGHLRSGPGHDELRHVHRLPPTRRRRWPSGARPSRSAPICVWSVWGWSSPATAGSHCSVAYLPG